MKRRGLQTVHSPAYGLAVVEPGDRSWNACDRRSAATGYPMPDLVSAGDCRLPSASRRTPAGVPGATCLTAQMTLSSVDFGRPMCLILPECERKRRFTASMNRHAAIRSGREARQLY
jgi:hypothetical protein